MKQRPVRKLLALVLSLLLVFAFTPTAFAAEISVADEQALHDAVANSAAGDVIKLTASFQLTKSVEIPADKNVVLDLNGQSITVTKDESSGRSLYAVYNNGTFTLRDSVGSGSITARGIQNNETGTMVIDSGKIVACDENGGACVWNLGNVTVTGGYFTTTFVGTPSDTYGIGCLNNQSSGNALITGGEFIDVNRRTYSVISTGHIEITPATGKNVTISGAHGGLAIDAGTAIVNGGTFSSTDFYALYVSNDGVGTDPNEAVVTVNGGDFTGKTYSVWVGSDVTEAVNSTVEINDGSFHNPIHAQDNADQQNAFDIRGGHYSEQVNEVWLDENVAQVSLYSAALKYLVGTSDDLDTIVSSEAKAEDTVEVLDGSVAFTNLQEGVNVKNSSEGTVSANGVVVEKGATVSAPAASEPEPENPSSSFTEPEYYPDYDEDVDYLPPVEDEEEEEKAPLYMVTCRTLNVRMGPGTSYAKLGTLSRGTLISGEYENGWVKFTYNGQTAYSSADYLMQVDGDLSGLHVTCRTLNVRAGAGTNFDILGTLSRGTEISVRDVLPGWYEIDFLSGIGYVSSAYIG